MSFDLAALEQLTFGITPAPRSELGARGELKWLPLSVLFIDPNYQRRILDSGKANIRRMIEAFSWQQFGTLTVSMRAGGRFAVIDGQHRATAAMLHGGISEVPCLIHAMTPVDEARAFSAMNSNVTRIHSLQTFRAKVAAGDASAVAIVELLGRADVTLCGYPKQVLAAGETMGLGAIGVSLNRHGPQILVAALKLLRAADTGSGIPAAAILGAATALAEQGHNLVLAKKHGAQLPQRGGIVKMMDEAEKRRATYGGPVWKNFQHVIGNTLASIERTAGLDMSKLMGRR